MIDDNLEKNMQKYKNWPNSKKIPSTMTVIEGYVIDISWSEFFPGAEIVEDIPPFMQKKYYLWDGMYYNLETHEVEYE